MSKLTERLTKKMSPSIFFIVLASRGYLRALKNLDGDITTQINIARKLKKPFFIVIDSRLSNNEIEEIDKYFSGDNIIKRITVNISDKNSAKDLALEIKKISKELSGEDSLRIITSTSHEDDKE